MVYYRTVEYRGNFPKIHAIVKGELFTEKEVQKYNIPEKILEKVEISCKKVYFFFGLAIELYNSVLAIVLMLKEHSNQYYAPSLQK